ncbi:probable E3 SUMO-protein ligase RNF212 [Spea bombifrons]|uniref:probable E3 SUMO-protein ligase RNF212 n=1 Tax=Spea bombifrons TaxID=233779 RepID=UPI002349E040|nr:probable E3 SUMO-protein ligase RNF212 [Spea bombifrons]
MAAPLRCNVCFRQPVREVSRFALTNCGHVLCEPCLQKGTKDECAVCKNMCRTIFLSNQTNPEVKMFFMDINVICKKYSKELSQISEFQESHRRRLLTHYKAKIAKLEDTIKTLTQQLQSFHTFSDPQGCINMPSSHIQKPSQSSVSSMVRNPGSAVHSESQSGYSSYSRPLSRHHLYQNVDNVDPSASLKKNLQTVAAPSRLSLISPPQDGRMGHIISRSNSQSSVYSALRSAQLGSSQQASARCQFSQPRLQIQRTGAWDISSQMQQPLPQSSQSSAARHPISLSGILQRRL